MPIEITMPQLSDTMAEGTVVKWHKKEGDKVKAGEEVADVETDKATMPMEAFEGGMLAAILVKEGEKVSVGSVLAVLATGGEKLEDVKKQYAGGARAKAPAQQAADGGAAKVKQARQAAASDRVPPSASQTSIATLEAASCGELHEPDDVGHGATREPSHPVPALPSGPPTGEGNGHAGNGKRVFASPLARRIASDKGINLTHVQGSGPGGRVVQKDVLAAAASPRKSTGASKGTATLQVVPRVPRGEKQVIPLTKMRSAIVAALQKSKQSIPHFYETVDVDVEAVLGVRVKLNQQLEAEKIKLSIADFVAIGVCAALLQHPAVNATFDEKKGEITRHGDVNLGTAVAIPDGLIVPVLRGADQMRLRELRRRSADLFDRARAQRLKQDELTGGTFTISNLGAFGIREFSAIINPPQVAILAVGAAEKRAVVRDDQVVARTMMSLTLSADHRAVDGATAAEFLRTLKEMLEEPGMMLL